MMREKHEMGAQQILNKTGHNGRLISGQKLSKSKFSFFCDCLVYIQLQFFVSLAALFEINHGCLLS